MGNQKNGWVFCWSLWLGGYLVVWSIWISAGPVWNLLKRVPRDWQNTEPPGTFPKGDITEERLYDVCVYIYIYTDCVYRYVYIHYNMGRNWTFHPWKASISTAFWVLTVLWCWYQHVLTCIVDIFHCCSRHYHHSLLSFLSSSSLLLSSFMLFLLLFLIFIFYYNYYFGITCQIQYC